MYSDFFSKKRNRASVHAVGFVLSASGIAWLLLHYLGAATDTARHLEVMGLRVHGAAAMLALVMIGGIVTGHARTRLRTRRNRRLGMGLLASAAFLTVTGYLLYYAGNETLREQASIWHSVVGVLASGLFVGHLAVGRGVRARLSEKKNPSVSGRGSGVART